MKQVFILGLILSSVLLCVPASAVLYSFESDTDGFGSATRCSIAASSGDLVVTYTGEGDPYFYSSTGSAIDGSHDYMLVASIEMTIPGGVTTEDFQVFYRKLTDPGAWEYHSFHFPVTANVGKQTYVVHIPEDLTSEGKANEWQGETIDQIRIDPGVGYSSGSTCKIGYLAFTTTRWDFNTDGDFENWSAVAGIQSGSGVSGGQLTYNITTTTTDPMWNTPTVNIPSDDFTWLKVRVRNYTATTGAILFFDSDLIGGYTGGHQANYAINPNDTQISEYWVNLAAVGNWANATWMDRFRFDMPDNPLPTTGTRFDVDQVMLSTSGPSAPTIDSITRTGGASGSWTSAGSLSWDVRFSHSMNTVASSDFTVTRTSGSTAAGAIASVTKIGPTWYRVTANVSGTGALRLDGVANQAARDVANQAMSAAYTSGESYQVDREGPSTPITPSDDGDYITSVTVLFNWSAVSDSGSGLAGYNLQIGTSPGAGDAFDGNVGNTLSKSITGLDGQTYYARVQGVDAVGNTGSWSANSDGVTVDTSAPAPVVSGDASITNTTKTLSIDFGESVSGFTAGGVLVGNGNASNLQGGPQTYTIDINTSGNVTVTVSINPGQAVDVAGNLNGGSNVFSYQFDNINPNPTVSGDNSPASGTRTLSVDFGEDVSGLVAGDISVANGAASNVQGGPQVYTMDIDGASPGQVTVQVPAAAAQDTAGNDAYASNLFSFYFDAAPPAPILSGDTGLTNATRSLSLDFGEQVAGFVVGDIDVTNGTASNLQGGPIAFTFDVDGSATGTVSVQIPAGAVQDLAANDNLVSNLFSYDFDNEAPTPLISGDATITNTTKTLSIDFGESISGFVLGNITVSNGAASNLQGGPQTYTVDIDGASVGQVTVSLAADIVTDAAGNLSEASNSFSFDFDASRPTTSITGSFALTNTTRELSITFNEAVSGFEVGDINVTNGTASNLQGGPEAYTVDVDGSGTVTVSVQIPENVATDAAGNANRATSFAYLFDNVAPTPVISGDSSLTNAPRTLNIAFGEIAKNFTQSDISVSNGVASGLSNLGGGNYSVLISGSGEATVEVSIPANRATDNAGNANEASNTFSFAFDDVRPTPVISGNSAIANGQRTVDIDFGEEVTSFDLSMLQLSNGVASNLQNLGNGAYRVDLNATGVVSVSIAIAANLSTDPAGNLNTASNTFSYAFDNVAPSPVISGETSLTNAPRTLRIDFGESVSGFSLAGLIVSNGLATNLQDLGNGQFSVDLRGAGQSTVYVFVNAGAAVDAAGNANVQSNTFTFDYDDTAPTPTVSGETTSTVAPRIITIEFDEAISGFGIEHITVENASATNFQDLGGYQYSIEVIGDLDALVSISVAADQVTDVAGNLNEASNTLSYHFEAIEITPNVSTAYNDAGAITLTCSINQATGAPTFSWYRRVAGGPDEAFGSGDSGLLSSVLTLDPALTTLLGENSFYCLVQDDAGANSSAEVSVVIGSHLSISQDLEDAVLESGVEFTWTIAYTGGLGAVTVEWYKDGEEKALNPIDDGDGDPLTLHFDAVAVEDSGRYEVHISDEGDGSGAFDTEIRSASLEVSSGVPIAGVLGLGLLSLTTALSGALGLRRRKR